MGDIIIPSFSIYGAYIFITILITYIVKIVIKYKPFYPYIPCIVGVIIGFATAFLSCGFCPDFINEFIKSSFIISAGAIASYDVVVEKVERYLNNYKETQNDTNDTK